MRNPIIVSIVNHKGGVLKTTTTANLGAALARKGKKVLLCDFDPQQNLTVSLVGQLPYDEEEPTLFDALMDEKGLDHLVRPTSTKNLDLVPSSEDFAFVFACRTYQAFNTFMATIRPLESSGFRELQRLRLPCAQTPRSPPA